MNTIIIICRDGIAIFWTLGYLHFLKLTPLYTLLCLSDHLFTSLLQWLTADLSIHSGLGYAG